MIVTENGGKTALRNKIPCVFGIRTIGSCLGIHNNSNNKKGSQKITQAVGFGWELKANTNRVEMSHMDLYWTLEVGGRPPEQTLKR